MKNKLAFYYGLFSHPFATSFTYHAFIKFSKEPFLCYFDAKEEWSLVATSSLSCLSEKMILQQMLPIYSCYRNSQLSTAKHKFYKYQPLIQNASTEQVQHVFANHL